MPSSNVCAGKMVRGTQAIGFTAHQTSYSRNKTDTPARDHLHGSQQDHEAFLSILTP